MNTKYYTENGVIRNELLDKEAYNQAYKFVKIINKQGKPSIDSRASLSSAQLRKFFGEFRQLEKRVKIEGFEKVKPLIKMVKSRAAYAANPGNRKIPQSFKEFLVTNIDNINSEEDFKAFMLHFEAVVGFFYGIPGVSNN